MHDVVLLNILDGVEELGLEAAHDLGCEAALVDEAAQGISVGVVGDDRHAHSGHFLEVVDHHDVGMGEVVAGIKLLAEHLAILGDVGVFLFQGLEHHPFAVFLSGVDIIEFLLPLWHEGEVAPFPRGVGDGNLLLFPADVSLLIHSLYLFSEYQLMMSKPVYFLRHSGTMIPSGVWLFSSSAATMRGRASAEPLRVWQSLIFLSAPR